MIGVHIRCKPGNDNYRRLANYIVDASHDGEKSLMHWCAGTWAGDDEYQLSILEVEDTQDLNTRTRKEKTYHLMISFRPEDEAKLTPAMFREAEMEFAKALGFEGHQRHCGVHKNTDNIHLHISYNMIHPERLTRMDPFRDFYRISQVCRALEQKYGLTSDLGADKTVTNEAKISHKIQTIEAHSGRESLASYIKARKPRTMEALKSAKTWEDLHRIFSGYGLVVKPHGNGLVIKDAHGKKAAKASDVDRAWSKTKLENRFGPYQAAKESHPEEERYSAHPLQQGADRANLFEQYQRETQERQAAMEQIKADEVRILAPTKKKWADHRMRLQQTPMLRRERQRLLQLAKVKEQEELAQIRKIFNGRREEIRRARPGTTWIKFLKHQASAGNEIALAVLRSKKETVEPEQAEPGLSHAQAVVETIAQDYRERQKTILSAPNTNAHSRKALLAVAWMQKLAAETVARGQGALVQGLKHTIDGKGTVIFHFKNGGTLRDTGWEIHFSNQAIAETAQKLARLKWGERFQATDQTLKRVQEKSLTQGHQQPPKSGPER